MTKIKLTTTTSLLYCLSGFFQQYSFYITYYSITYSFNNYLIVFHCRFTICNYNPFQWEIKTKRTKGEENKHQELKKVKKAIKCHWIDTFNAIFSFWNYYFWPENDWKMVSITNPRYNYIFHTLAFYIRLFLSSDHRQKVARNSY